MNKKTRNALAMMALGLVAVAAAVGMLGGPLGTIISINQIYVDASGGTDQNGKLTGSFWNIVAAVTTNDVVSGVTLPKGTNGSTIINGIQEIVHTNATVEIRIDPQQPYLTRKIKRVDVMVSPKTYRSWGLKPAGVDIDKQISVSAVTLTYYTWDEPQFRIYAPYDISVYQNGVLIGTKTINTEGVAAIQTVDTSAGTIRIENLGGLTGNYLTPNVPSQISFWSGGKNYVYDWAQCNSYVPYDQGVTFDPTGLVTDKMNFIRQGSSNAYSLYWYGQYYRWVPALGDNSPAGFQTAGYGAAPIDQNLYGGWMAVDDFWAYHRDPVAPPIYPTDKSSLPADKKQYKSLTEYIEGKGVANLAYGLFSQWQSWEINPSQFYVRINIPWGAYQVPIVNFRVPTELADTWIDKPPISNVRVSATWDRTGTKSIEILNTERIRVDLTQLSQQLSGCHLTATSSVTNAHVYPPDMTVPSMAPGENRTVYFDVTNSGTTIETAVVITIVSYDTYANQEKSRDSITGTLLVNVGQEETVLRLLCKDSVTKSPVVGAHVQIVYPPGAGTQKDGFTTNDGSIQFLVSGSGTSGYTGQVFIQVPESTKYKEYDATIGVSPGTKEYQIDLVPKGQPEGDWSWIFWVIGIAGAGTAGTVIYTKRKRLFAKEA